jgi:hypothetical protein
MKVLASVMPPVVCLAAPRLAIEDYRIDVERFFEKVIICQNSENHVSIYEFQKTYPDRFIIFEDYWRQQPRLHREFDRCDFQISATSDIKSCFADEKFKTQLEVRKPRGKLAETRDKFYERVFEPFVEAAEQIKIVDPYLLSNLSNRRSGAYWLLEKKLSGCVIRLILITVEPRTKDSDEKLDLERKSKEARDFLTRISRDTNTDICLYILPSSSNLSFDINGRVNDETSDKHDRLWQFSYPDGILGIGLTKGTEYFASEKLKSTWGVELFSVPDFAQSLDVWLLHDNQQAKSYFFGREFDAALGLE